MAILRLRPNLCAPLSQSSARRTGFVWHQKKLKSCFVLRLYQLLYSIYFKRCATWFSGVCWNDESQCWMCCTTWWVWYSWICYFTGASPKAAAAVVAFGTLHPLRNSKKKNRTCCQPFSTSHWTEQFLQMMNDKRAAVLRSRLRSEHCSKESMAPLSHGSGLML